MGGHQSSTQQSYIPKLIKLDFLRFNGDEDTASWVCRVEQFFHLYQTPKDEHVELGSFHLKGDPQLWFQLINQK